MNLLFLFKCISDFSFFFALANYVAYACGGSGVPFTAAVLPVAALFLGSLTAARKPRLRLLPLLLLPLGLLFLHHGGDRAVYLCACCYCALLVQKQLFAQSYTDACLSLSRNVAVLLALPFLALISGGFAMLTHYCVPYVLLFLGASILQTRMLRHDSATLKSRGFLLKNLLALAGVAALSLAASAPRFLALLAHGGKLLYQATLFPVLMLLAYAASAIIWLLGKILDLLNIRFSHYQPRPQEIAEAVGVKNIEYKQITEMDPRVKAVILALVAVLVIALAAFLLYKLVASHRRRPADVAFTDTREKLETRRPPRREYFAPRDPQKAVRHYYRRFLEECRGKGVTITPESTTEEISGAAVAFFDAQAVSKLRDLYLEARYSGKPVTRQVAKEAKEAYNQIVRPEKNQEEASQ